MNRKAVHTAHSKLSGSNDAGVLRDFTNLCSRLEATQRQEEAAFDYRTLERSRNSVCSQARPRAAASATRLAGDLPPPLDFQTFVKLRAELAAKAAKATELEASISEARRAQTALDIQLFEEREANIARDREIGQLRQSLDAAQATVTERREEISRLRILTEARQALADDQYQSATASPHDVGYERRAGPSRPRPSRRTSFEAVDASRFGLPRYR